jgi:putative Mn2+ efflux pump MntP
MFFSLEAFLLSLASSTDNFMVGLSVGLTAATATTTRSKRETKKHQRHPQPSSIVHGNLIISICNATGAYIAGYVGNSTKLFLPKYLSPLLATIAFAVLSIQEFRTFFHVSRQKQQKHDDDDDDDDDGSDEYPNPTQFNTSRAIQLALPMTLNNLAGGVAGGAVGVTPLEAGVYGFCASFVTMSVGEEIGQLWSTTATASRNRGRRVEHQQTRQRTNNIFIPNSRFQSLQVLLDPSFVSASLLGFLCLMSLHEVWDAIER